MKNLKNTIIMCIFVVAIIFLSAARVNAQKADQKVTTKVETDIKFQPVLAMSEMQNSAGDSAASVTEQKADQIVPAKVEVGIKFQPVLGMFKMQNSSGDNIHGQEVLGYGGGIYMNYNFTKYLGIQIEMNYSSYSRKYSESNITRTVNLRYIEIPFLVSFNSNKNTPSSSKKRMVYFFFFSSSGRLIRTYPSL